MTVVALGPFEAKLNGRRWACYSASIRRMFGDRVGRHFLHGGIPDVEQAIVLELQKTPPVRAVSAPPFPDYSDTSDDVIS